MFFPPNLFPFRYEKFLPRAAGFLFSAVKRLFLHTTVKPMHFPDSVL